ncbi:hypothetical protein SLE2022_221920 [Rubroshorea leprosula]
MGDFILGSVVEAAVSKVIAFASDLFNLAVGGNEDLPEFRDTMMRLRGFLQDANEKNVSGHLDLKSWLQDLRDIADEADDILEEVAYEGMQREVKKSKVRHLTLPDPSPLLFRQKMANRVEDLNKRLADINSSAHQLGLQHKLANMLPEPRGWAGRETHSFLSSQVYGREEDVSKIVRLLVDSSSQHDLPVMIIVGMAGLGKTTIAKAVLKNDEIREHFGDNKMWVCVSENFDVKKILMEMLKSCSGSSSGDGDFGSKDTVMKEIQKKLGEKNYLLILDDVWNEERERWEDLRDCLLGISESKGSRGKVLVTTRLEDVASLMALTDEHIHCPRQLKEDDCWSIIKQRAFGENSVPEGLEGIGKQIAKRCKGIPLVASIIGAILQKKRDKREWQAITENRVWDSLEKEAGILDIIKYSYDRLPTLALKQCFAFCSIFPKDFVMEREMLIQLWMALGFLESPEEISNMAAEDIGDKYFRYLLSYSLFQEERRDNVTRSVESCKMHDLIHDFAQSISKSEMLIVERRLGSNISHDVRHLNLIDGREIVATILGDVAKKLQTLFSKHSFSNGVQVDLIRLRVLSLKDASDAKQLPTCFGNLKSLRYLDISRTQIEKLPKFITKLYNLQTFRFMDCKSLQMPPSGIGDLINLRHVYFNDEECMPANLGRLTNLQTLPLFVVGTTEGHKIEELGSLRELKGRLEIRKLELVTGKSEAEGAKLKEKAVEHLKFCWSEGKGNQDKDEDVLEGLHPPSNVRRLSIACYGGRNLASWMSKSIEELLSLNNLVELTISSCRLLNRIPSLNWFSSLQRLSIESCYELTSLGDDDEAVLTSMSLKELSISQCGKLKSFPVSGISSLEKLHIRCCYELTGLGDCDGALRLKSLKQLSIIGCKMLERFLINGLPSLEELKIEGCRALNSIGDSLSSSRCLQLLYLIRCPKLFIPSLEGLIFLKTITIWDCDRLECLPSGLSSCTALEKLNIWNCSNLVSIVEELKQLRSLLKLDIENCQNLKFIPSIEGLISLKTIIILYCYGLECLPSGLSSCTSLEELQIRWCSNLVSIPEELKQLPSLVQLEITFCEKLRNFPEAILDLLVSLKRLELGPFSEELKEFPNLSSTSTSTPASLEVLSLKGWGESVTLPRQIQRLTALRDLTISYFNEVEDALMGNLSCLKTLTIRGCTRLRRLSSGLSSLEKLSFEYCPNPVSFQGELKDLRSLTIQYCPELGGFLEESLGCCTRLKRLELGPFSEELQEFPNLSSTSASVEDLTLRGWKKLTHLPQIQHLTALKELSIYRFSGMESLPDWFNNLSSLQQLEIWSCPDKLKERCTKGSGPDWHKISHISNIKIGGETIQSQH